ncbi:hypothetical protein BU25DRAFT_462182 [Macroventuria anomochaeta]|uniref:Uncharacterized protein n=1 Tax=Macroventuria anomochaeta TaxID=301207 RepID=A0ACB6RMM9_9PLEO|nr:uncharacterized protein BU25DRAFT_462182 [Macroventuria anomochaeta]KAF2623286.1 hypothetical protein BU25DRAFT_462182 [Macroventuria anomochaeta]
MNAQDKTNEAFVEKFEAWQAEVIEVGREQHALMDKFMAHEDATPADCDAVATGRERKASALISPFHPKEAWPRTVPYLNMIPRSLYEEEEADHRRGYMKQYHAIVRKISRRGNETFELKRIAVDTSPKISFETLVTMEQTQQWRAVLQAEKQKFAADKAQFEMDLNNAIIAQLRDQPGWSSS